MSLEVHSSHIGKAPVIQSLRVVPVAGRDSMLLNLSGAHGPWFTRNIDMATPVVNKVLIIGGGFSGMAAAIELRKQDIEVDVVEIDPGWRSYGAGISLGGATLRAFRRLGILESLLEHGAASDGVEIFIPPGQKVAELPTPRIAGPDVPGNGGIMRPVLARILADATRASGASVRLGGTVTQGVIDFPRIFDHANVAGMKHYYVEHDFPHDPIASITTSFQYLRRMFNSH